MEVVAKFIEAIEALASVPLFEVSGVGNLDCFNRVRANENDIYDVAIAVSLLLSCIFVGGRVDICAEVFLKDQFVL